MAVYDYHRLVTFTNSLRYSTMKERVVTKAVYEWMDNISSDITEDYRFFVTYIFNRNGIAVDALIYIEKIVNSVWYKCGEYSAFSKIDFSSIICGCEETVSQVSTKESETIHYYINGYYINGYYV